MKNPSLTWKNNLPYSENFQDTYFSEHGAIEESRHVFLEGNDLPKRFQNCEKFIIGELGFGTGLNFAVTSQAWEKYSLKHASLEYISIEKFPLDKSTIKKISTHWPELKKYFSSLLENYPLRIDGFHHISFPEKNIQLTLIFEDVLEALKNIHVEVDAWYLDGFAPKRNPQMWNEAAFKLIAKNTQAGGSLATYSSAGEVRRQLTSVGFEIKKRSGFAKKREMLYGILPQKIKEQNKIKAWWRYPKISFRQDEKKAIIIGAGMAGCWTARALADRGWQVEVFEKNSQIAMEASGNRASILYPYRSLHWDKYQQFYNAGFAHSLRTFRALQKKSDFSWNECGLIQLAKNSQEAERFQKITQLSQVSEEFIQYVDAKFISEQTGAAIQQSGLYYPCAGWLDPRQLCLYLVNHPKIHLHLNQHIDQIKRTNENWQIFNTQNQVLAEKPIIIIANAYAAEKFSLLKAIPLQQVRGQVAYLDDFDLKWNHQTILCGEKSFFPLGKNHFDLGATFEPKENSSELLENSQQENLKFLKKIFPKINFSSIKDLKGRVGFRTTSEDRLPIVGPLFDEEAYLRDYSDLQHGRPDSGYPSATYLPGIFVNIGHGARGLTSSGICGEWLAGYLNGEVSCLNQNLVEALHPARFLIKKLKKKIETI
ncbi:MAG: bifunctional tRNA (5-methylaminomethyl-2-thiouridine)(34)-methyltransferase MnmD/FAD-dependent 5-carboxymethylaminomethyl-2-thiouridine(34) oxidoreductase MnmC [Deltaproteobacteria bacterium]|nr:bifunctional tRNA (5-methylaminomethyl-2-thiouridine)(34)-methyltransferase MnmD/FAD-dependent 5-carboxymethylaminomethyl-2-thiouridine(34) oxidoreductase MnmC [Deltaproteobacteria bacterium]